MPGERVVREVLQRAGLRTASGSRTAGDATVLNGETNKRDKETTERVRQAEEKGRTASLPPSEGAPE